MLTYTYVHGEYFTIIYRLQIIYPVHSFEGDDGGDTAAGERVVADAMAIA